MSKQAKIRTKSIVEYKAIPLFNHDCENLFDYLQKHCHIAAYTMQEDYYNVPNWEIRKSELKELIKKLEAKPKPMMESCGYTAGQLIDMFQSWIDISSKEENFSDNDFIYIDWF